MIEFHPQIRSVHILCITLSGSLFLLRGLGVLSGARWPKTAPVRWLSYAIDTTLLTAAMMLVVVLPGAVFANGWLYAKLALLPVYIVLGVLALGRAPTPRARRLCFLGAVAVFLTMVSIARHHHPLGLLSTLLS